MSSVPWVRLMSWRRMRGTLARLAIRSKVWEIELGWTVLPSVLVRLGPISDVLALDSFELEDEVGPERSRRRLKARSDTTCHHP